MSGYWWWSGESLEYVDDPPPVTAEREIYKVVSLENHNALSITEAFNAITAEDPEWTMEYITDFCAVFVKTVPVEAPAK